MSKFGPSRSELRFRLWVSLAGLALLAGALICRGLPLGLAMFEVLVISTAFFGGTALWALYKLRKDRPDGS